MRNRRLKAIGNSRPRGTTQQLKWQLPRCLGKHFNLFHLLQFGVIMNTPRRVLRLSGEKLNL